MKRLLPIVAVSVAALLALIVQSGRSGDQIAAGLGPTVALNFQPEQEPAPGRRVRLPNYYGQLGVTEVQRQRIYALQLDYGKKIDDLEAQLAVLRAKRDQDCEAVLSEGQRTKLAEIRKEREKGKARKNSTAKASPQP